MTRRLFLLAAAVPAAVRAEASEPQGVFAELASALAERDSRDFIHHFDPDMEGIDTLRDNIEALVEQADVICSIAFVSRRDEGNTAILEVDWAMTLQSRGAAAGGPTERRRRVLTAKLRHEGKKWQIVSLTPLDFFDPPRYE